MQNEDKANRNKELARRMKELAGENVHQYEQFKAQAAAFRQGKLQGVQLWQKFVAVFGQTREAEDVWIDMATLLPMSQQTVLLQCLEYGVVDDEWSHGMEEMEWQSLNMNQFTQQDPQYEVPQLLDALQSQCSYGQNVGFGEWQNSIQSKPAKAASQHKDKDKDKDEAGGGSVIVWMRQDFRLHDNHAITSAAQIARRGGGRIIFTYIHSPEEDGDDYQTGKFWRPAGASCLWIEQALKSFEQSLIKKFGVGAAIVYRLGPYLSTLQQLVALTGAKFVVFNRRHEPAMINTDRAVQQGLQSAGVYVKSFNALLLREPEEVKLDMSNYSGMFGTLIPFYMACIKLGMKYNPMPSPTKLPVGKDDPRVLCQGLALENLGLYRRPVRKNGERVDWGAPICSSWDISEEGAMRLLEDFIRSKLQYYETKRMLADARACSKLSPYIHFGQLSPTYMMKKLYECGCPQISKTFWRRLVWRDLAYWQLYHWPTMAAVPIRSPYVLQEWNVDKAAVKAWQKGQTGFPLVDAGMRELWQTGWMQQNVRMACALLLTEYLNIHWIEGARWFHDTLVDADLAINSMMWQNAGKSGLDQWNFTVVPTSSSKDPSGEYIRKWVPELRQLPKDYLYEPWEAPKHVLKAAGVELGATYPHRICDVPFAQLRLHNTRAIRKMRQQHVGGLQDNGGYDVIVVPPGASTGHDGQKMRIYTKREYRILHREISVDEVAPLEPGKGRKRGRTTGIPGNKEIHNGRQSTMDEYIVRTNMD